MGNVIEAQSLVKHYGEIYAVNGVSFEVREGETFGFLGPNGAGKTTTIRMLTGLSKPSSGKARVLGYAIEKEAIRAKKLMGVVPEASNLYDELSAFDNLMFMSQLYGVPRGERNERVLELLRKFGLYERRNHLFGNFSRGMKRALTVAAALTNNPRVLFLDEPTVGLDVLAVQSLHNLIGSLKREGVTIFLTTHYLEEADHLCDRIAIMVGGKILKIDTPEALKASVYEGSIIDVSFARMPPTAAGDISEALRGLQVAAISHNSVRINGGYPEEVIGEVLHYAKENGIEISSVNSVRPRLEDAFVRISGLSPTIMASEKGGRR
jgi:ABC-2 type transport system ATP-binding protein